MSDQENNQAATQAAFEVLYVIARKRLVEMAREFHCLLLSDARSPIEVYVTK